MNNRNISNKLSNVTKNIGNRLNKVSESWFKGNLSRGQKFFVFIFILLIILFIGLIINEVKKSTYDISHVNDLTFFTNEPHKADTSVIIEGTHIESSSTTEFTYTFWLYVNSSLWNTENNGNWKHILHRGNVDTEKTNPLDGNLLLQVPGIWLYPNTNRLWCVVSTEGGPEYGEGLIFDNLAIDRWTHISVVLLNNTLDLYIDGKLEKTITLYKNTKIVNNMDHLYLFGLPDNIKDLMTSETVPPMDNGDNEEDVCIKCKINKTNDACIIAEDEEELVIDEDIKYEGRCIQSTNPLGTASTLADTDCGTCTCNNEDTSTEGKTYAMDGFMGHFKYFNKYLTSNEIYDIYKEKAGSINNWDYKYLEQINSIESNACETYKCFQK